jgi:hypothetical protein
VSKAVGTQKYVICNAGEGDPGAFMDRSVLTHVHFPYRYPKEEVDASHDRFVIDHNRGAV